MLAAFGKEGGKLHKDRKKVDVYIKRQLAQIIRMKSNNSDDIMKEKFGHLMRTEVGFAW